MNKRLLRQDGLKLGSEGYSLAYAIAEENLLIRNTVIADSVNPLPITRNAWRAIAERNGARSIEIEVVCSDRTQHRYRVESRGADIPGHKMPTWQEIIDREYCSWETKDLVIDTADQTKEEAFQKLLQNLGDLL